MQRCCFLLGVFIFLRGLLLADVPWQLAYENLLSSYVREDGVRYAAWAANATDRQNLLEVVTAMGKVNPQKLTDDERLAFYINAYNAWMIYLVLENYPITSVTEIGKKPFSVFSDKLIRLHKKPVSLDFLEKETLLKEFPDARIHFAVNCASRGCPPLASIPFRAETIEAQLAVGTKKFLASPYGVQVDEESQTVAISSLFDWYQKDFLRNNPAGVLPFINTYREPSVPLSYQITFQSYDWNLNTASEK